MQHELTAATGSMALLAVDFRPRLHANMDRTVQNKPKNIT